MKDQIEALIKKAAEAPDSADAMRFSQAAQNTGNIATTPQGSPRNLIGRATNAISGLFGGGR